MVSDVSSGSAAPPHWADTGRTQGEKVIYYKRKDGWITWGDTQPSKQILKLRRGHTPLEQYGEIKDSADFWGPILRHPQGPSEFPVEQILAYRWYRPDQCPVAGVVFPQLAGVKVIEFICPECPRSFHSPIHLGTHLRVMHEYDRSEVLKYGDRMNIDFSKVPGGKEAIEYDFTVSEPAVVSVQPELSETFTTVSAAHPATAEIKENLETVKPFLSCPDCTYTTAGKQKHEFALSTHRRVKHSAPTEAVPA